jgi:hypothetical protein
MPFSTSTFLDDFEHDPNTKTNMLLPWLVVLAGHIFLTSGIPFSPSSPTTNTTHALHRRQCTHRPNSDQYDCDFTLPTLTQIIEHLRDKPHGGMADADHSALFYTNLAYPNTAVTNKELGWIHAYNIAQGIETKVYWLQSNVDFPCKCPAPSAFTQFEVSVG